MSALSVLAGSCFPNCHPANGAHIQAGNLPLVGAAICVILLIVAWRKGW